MAQNVAEGVLPAISIQLTQSITRPPARSLVGMASAEERLIALGVPVEATDFGTEVDPQVSGCLLVRQFSEGLMMRATVRQGVIGDARELFAEWAESRFLRFGEHGPEPDGWQKRSDGDWQLWVRLRQMPDLD
jgi:hypothetical protein